MKVLVILVDGMTPDALRDTTCAQDILNRSACAMQAQTVMPSVTLPCHMSLFHSVDPTRHGTTTNVYAPQVRPVKGLCEVLTENQKTCAFFYNWEELRDLSRPGSLVYSCFCRGENIGYDQANNVVTDEAIRYLASHEVDFTFLYLGYVDAAGHQYGWKSRQYADAMDNSWENINRIVRSLPDDYTVIITADHGGHDRMHGFDLPEDMTIPLVLLGKDFKAGEQIEDANIKDIAPTVAALLGVAPDGEWEGKSLL